MRGTHNKGFIEIFELSALCDNSLWIGSGFHEKTSVKFPCRVDPHLHCEGRYVAHLWLPSGDEATKMGICTCPCHARNKNYKLRKSAILK